MCDIGIAFMICGVIGIISIYGLCFFVHGKAKYKEGYKKGYIDSIVYNVLPKIEKESSYDEH